MRKLLLIIACFLLIGIGAGAQVFTMSDTVYATNPSSAFPVHDDITNPASTGFIRVKWSVVGTNFPSDWIPKISLCDNFNCYYNMSNTLWNGVSGNTQTSDSIKSGKTANFDAPLDLSATTTNGSFYIKVNIQEPVSSYSKNVYFVITKTPVGVSSVVRSEDDIAVYPNPANNQVNIVFNEEYDVKMVGIYNLIGKMESIYKVVGNSAGINIENLPKGIYFVRLINGQGNVVVTRKFTKE